MSRIYLSYLAWPELKEALAREGHQICVLSPKQAVSEPISAHPDIYMCKMGTSPKSPVSISVDSRYENGYPSDVPYNAVVTEKYIICNVKTVSTELVCAAKQLYPGLEIINVAQGYTKCNVVVVDERHFITEDVGIFTAEARYRNDHKTVEPENSPEFLLISSGNVEIPGFKRGFIGGVSGRIGNDIWFNGDITMHPDYLRIRAFIDELGLGIRYVPGKKLTDIGSIIEEQV